MPHSAKGNELNIVAQRFDGDNYDNPYGWICVTTEQFRGTKKVRMDEISQDNLFVCYVDRLTGNITYEPTINDEKAADDLMNQLRLNALSYDKTKRISEIEQLIKTEEARGFGQELGKESATKTEKK